MLLLISTATFIKTENKEAAKRLGNAIFEESGGKMVATNKKGVNYES